MFGVPDRVADLDLPDDVDGVRGRQVGALGGHRVPADPRRPRLGRPPPPADLDALLAGPDPAAPRRLAVLEGLNDHENLGSIARSAVALGIDGLLLDPRCADPFYRRSVRVSMGHMLTLPFAVLSDWPGDLDRLHDAGYTTVALTPAADAVDLDDVDPRAHPRTAVLLGRRGAGADARGAGGGAGAGEDPDARRAWTPSASPRRPRSPSRPSAEGPCGRNGPEGQQRREKRASIARASSAWAGLHITS